MINDILQKDTIKADLGFGVDYYKGEDGKTPVKGVDYFTPEDIEQIENQLATPATKDKIGGIKLGDGNTKSGVKDTFMRKGQQLAVDDDKPDTPYITYASNLTPGVVQVNKGNGLEYSWGSISMSPATSSTLGTVKPDGTTITVDGNGVLTSVGGGSSSYTLPVADNDKLGGIKLGNTNQLTIQDNLGSYGASLHAGIDKADVPIIPYADGGISPGVVRVSAGNGLTYSNGVVSMSPASTTTYGTVAYDGKTIQAKLNPSDQPTLYAATATTSSLGVIKPDGTTTTVDANGNLSMIGKPAVIKTLTTGQAPSWVVDWVANPDKYIVMVTDCIVFSTMKSGTNFYYYWIQNDTIEQYYIKFTDTTFTTPASSQPDYNMAATQLITANNWQNYITAGGGSDWQYTDDQSNSDLYNAKELVVYVENTNGNRQMGYFNFGANGSNLGNYQGYHFYFDYDTSSPYIYYDGSSLGYGNANSIQDICYKT